MDNFKKYLPSKNFTAVVIFLALILGLFFGIKQTISYFKNRKINKDGKVVEMTVGGIIQKDSNDNGIADWEEYLWGLNPNKNGDENKTFILEKKKSLIQNGEMSAIDDSLPITESEILSREFFAAVISLQQTGELNEETMKSLSEAMGENIIPEPIADIYVSTILTIVDDSSSNKEEYFNKLGDLVLEYEDASIGSELTFIIQGLTNKDPQALYAAKTVGDAYISFGEEFVRLPTPKSLVSTHLNVANNYEKTGRAVIGLTQILTEPLIGMKSLINYKKYNELLISDLEKLSSFLQ